MEGKKYCSTQLVEADGTFNVAGIQNFVKDVNLAECGLSYAVISIMGAQSSGKSTLLNCLFETNFEEMDALKGRYKTTKGIWLAMARCASIEPCTLVMDLEGSDGRERGEDDTAFERQSALFALAVSDIVLINIWYHDIGREQAASKPLLRTVFQVMLRLFSPRKTTLMFVIRDHMVTPLELLKSNLEKDVHEIWNSIPRPQNHMKTRFDEFFKMEFVDLPSYYLQEEEFKKEVASLRQRFFHSIAPRGLAGDGQRLVPASAFSLTTQSIWKKVKENKDLDLPALKVMVAKLRCQEIAEEKRKSFVANKESLEKKVETDLSDFGKIFDSTVVDHLKEYDEETAYYDEGARSERRNKLEAELVQIGEPAYRLALGRIRSITLDKFKESFDKALNEGKEFSVAACDCTQSARTQFKKECAGAIVERANPEIFSDVSEELERDILTEVSDKLKAKLNEALSELIKALSEPVEELLLRAEDGTWRDIRKLLRDKNKSVASSFSALSAFNLDAHARGLVESVAKYVAGSAKGLMLARFQALFCCVDSRSSKTWPWKKKKNIQVSPEMAYSECLKMLSVLAAIRLNDDDDADNIEETLSIALMGANSIKSTALDMDTWQKVSRSNTMITPRECKALWKEFKDVTEQWVTNQKPASEIDWGEVALVTLKVGMAILNVAFLVTTGTTIIPW